jgi:hypothetical protein
MIRNLRRTLKFVFKKILDMRFRIQKLMWNRKYNRISEDEKFRIVFFLSVDSEWDCFASIYEAFLSDSSSELVVVADDYPRRKGQLASDFLSDNGILFVKSGKRALKNIKPHLIFVADEISVARNDWIFRIGARIVYIPYGTSVSSAKYSQNQQYNLPLHNSAWKIFVAGGFARKLYGDYCDAGNGHVIALGHPKTQVIYSNLDDYQFPAVPFSKEYPAKFLWNIHYDRNGGWSTWNDYGVDILNLFASRDDVLLICRPHPFFFDSFESEDEALAVRSFIVKNKNTTLDEEASMKLSFSKCDALLTDGSSLIYDFFITGKPLLYMRSMKSYRMHPHSFNLIKTHHYIGTNLGMIRNFVNMVCSNTDFLRDGRRDQFYRDAKIPKPLDIGVNIRRYIEDELASFRK